MKSDRWLKKAYRYSGSSTNCNSRRSCGSRSEAFGPRGALAMAKENGKRWGGRQSGQRVKVNGDQTETIKLLRKENKPVTAIARTVGLSRRTIYSVPRGPKKFAI